MSEQEDKQLGEDPDFELPRLSSITFNIASGFNPNLTEAENITEANRYMVNQLSEAVAKVNRPHFAKRLEPILDKHGDYIKESEIALIDRYGRATYFYCKLGNQIIPIYQPGTIMFESAVKSESKLNVEHGGSQQNGPLLGNGCATFLAKFHCNLIATYQKLCAINELDSSHFYPDKYKQSLKENLVNFGVEDAKEHGRLISMQETLLSLGGTQMQKDDEMIKQFHLKDLSEIQGRPIEEIGEEADVPLSYKEYLEISQMRKKDLYYSESEDLFKGKCVAERTLQEYGTGLATKTGLVPPDQDTMFKLQMQALITQISEQKNTIQDQVVGKIKPKESAASTGASKGILSTDGRSSKHSKHSKVSYLQSLYSDSNEEEELNSVNQDKMEQDWMEKAVKVNARVKTYIGTLAENLRAMLEGKYPPHSKAFNYSSNKPDVILNEIGEFVPAVGKVLSMFGLILANMEKGTIEARLDEIKGVVENRELLVEQVVQELTIRRRGFIQTIEAKDMRKIVRNFEKMKTQFHIEDLYPEEILVEIDLRSLQAAMIGIDPSRYSKIYNEAALINEVEKDICEAFFNPQPFQSISPELASYEEPVEFLRGEPEFELHASLFTEFPGALPKYMKRMISETAAEHRKRCEDFIINIGQDQFDKLSMIVDPDSPRRRPLFHVYTDALKGRKKMAGGKNKGKCRVL